MRILIPVGETECLKVTCGKAVKGGFTTPIGIDSRSRAAVPLNVMGSCLRPGASTSGCFHLLTEELFALGKPNCFRVTDICRLRVGPVLLALAFKQGSSGGELEHLMRES